MSDPGGRVGTSRSYMMYTVRGNRGGAETDGRAEDPFEAAARGASASVPWKFFYLTLCLPPSHSPIPRRVTDRAKLLRLRNQAQRKTKSALNPSPGATLRHCLNHPTAGEQKIFPQRIERGLVRIWFIFLLRAKSPSSWCSHHKKGISSFVDFPWELETISNSYSTFVLILSTGLITE